MALKIGCTDDRPQDCKASLGRGALSLLQSWAEKQFGEVAVRRSSYQIVQVSQLLSRVRAAKSIRLKFQNQNAPRLIGGLGSEEPAEDCRALGDIGILDSASIASVTAENFVSTR